MTDDQERALTLRESGRSRAEIAAMMGRSEKAVKRLLERARANRDASNAAKLAGTKSSPHSYWLKKDGISAYYKSPVGDAENVLDLVATAFNNVRPYEPVPVIMQDNDLLAVYPLYDAHAGMMAWGRETRGPDYDLSLFASDLQSSIDRINSRVPPSGSALVILGGDTIHTNDDTELTPGHKNKLDADGRFEKIVDVAIESICHAIEAIALRHASVSVVVLRGNHDETSHIILKAALKQRYRNVARIYFPVVSSGDKSDIFWMRHGSTLICAHHGDKMKPQSLAMVCASQCRDWSLTDHRVILTGHLHHLRVLDMPGVSHYTMRAFAPADAYGSNYGGIRGLQAMLFDNKHGLVAQFHDGVWRDE